MLINGRKNRSKRDKRKMVSLEPVVYRWVRLMVDFGALLITAMVALT